MKKHLFLVLLFVLPALGLSAQEYLNGKVKVVTAFPDYKVRVVTAFPDLKVQVVNSFPDQPGEWQFVDSFEDFSIQYVNAFEDFTIQFVNAFPGPTSNSTSTTKSRTAENSSNRNVVTATPSTSGFSKEPAPFIKRRNPRDLGYDVVVEEDSFSIPRRLPGRKFPIHARVQIVDTLPDLLLKYSSGHAFPNLKLSMDSTASDKKFHWQIVDSCPDFTIQFYNYWQYVDAVVVFTNFYDDKNLRIILYENSKKSRALFPEPDKVPPLPDCKPLPLSNGR